MFLHDAGSQHGQSLGRTNKFYIRKVIWRKEMNIKTEFDGTHEVITCPTCNNDYLDLTIGALNGTLKVNLTCANQHKHVWNFETYKGHMTLRIDE
jgi:hypothetical protein